MKRHKESIKKYHYISIILFINIILNSCRKDLCFNHQEHALTTKANIKLQWIQEWENPYKTDTYWFDWRQIWVKENWPGNYEDYKPDISKGIRTQIHTQSSRPIINNINNSGGILSIPQGQHELLFYSNDTEYIVFKNTENTVMATAGTRIRTRSGYKLPKGHEHEQTVNPPDMLYASYIPGYKADLSLEEAYMPVTMYPRTYSYLIRYKFKSGLKYVAHAKGALSGMADKIYIYDGHTDNRTATILFDCKIDELGCKAKVMSFGVPNFAYQSNEYTDNAEKLHFVLHLEVLLKNGKHLSYDLDVSKYMRAQPRGGILLFPDIEVSDKDGNESSGNFDTDIGEWEDTIDIPLTT